MNGLRLYARVNDHGNNGAADVFYSRRGNGPYYRWHYENIIGQWRVSRVIAPDFDPHSLALAPFKALPAALQTKLSMHYME
jgi:hypothetical protein